MICGLDLSLRASGLVALPLDWGGAWSRVIWHTIGEPLRRDATELEHVLRLARLAAQILGFVDEHGARLVVLEAPAYSRAGAGLWERGELSGMVKAGLLSRGVEVRIVPASAARKVLLGKVPRTDPKAAVVAALRAAGATFSTVDEAEAFCVANVVLAERGAAAFCSRAAA